MTTQRVRVLAYVASVTVLSILAMAIAWEIHAPFPGIWAIISCVAVAILLDRSSMMLRVSASGSTSLLVHLATAILFGGFWSGLIAAISTFINGITRGSGLEKTIFNSAQRALAMASATLVYQVALGGAMPPAFLETGSVSASSVQRDIFLYVVLVATYVTLNKILVSGAVALSSGRPFREVWHLNSKTTLSMDVGAGILSAFVAWFYFRVDALGYGPVGLIAVALPIVGLRHVYSLYQDLQESGQELLQVMVKAIEARDPYTSGHSLRVRELSRAIAIELGLSAQEIEEVETAALLHDVGKIHEEFAPLLRKENRLTDAETSLMQTHAVKSAELVGIIRKFRGHIQRSVRHHHERWDGQGYPDGLRSEDIPLASRIILIADTVDAMTTDRPYRKRLSLEVVIGELQRCKGTQFDPAIVDIAVSSVAVRRLIAGVSGTDAEEQRVSPRSIRVPRASGAFWRARRA